MNNITIDYENENIEVTSTFLKKAKIFGSDEWTELKKVRDAEPDFSVVEKGIKKNSRKKTYGKLTFDAMKAHIKHVETNEEDRAKVLKEFEEIKTYSAARGSSYPIVKKWFLDKYKDSYNDFGKHLSEAESKEEDKEDNKQENEVANKEEDNVENEAA